MAEGFDHRVHREPSASGPRTVVCGTFRRAHDQLTDDFEALRTQGCVVLSPTDVEFVTEVDGFVLAAHELGDDPRSLEQRHIRAIEQADMIWLHAPEGYVGSSAALELGVAHAMGIPVFSREAPADVTLQHFAQRVSSVEEAVRRTAIGGRHTPARPLSVLQTYYRRVASDRGYSSESPQDAMLLLTEEVGELARAIRKTVGLGRAAGFQEEDAAAELADVQLYILHLANILNVSLDEAVAGKERLNAAKAPLPAIAA